jgi:hypothetical protein
MENSIAFGSMAEASLPSFVNFFFSKIMGYGSYVDVFFYIKNLKV